MHIFYLHGFASSPESSKAQFFAERFAAHGISLHVPDFNRPDFTTLTISRMLRRLETSMSAMPPGDVVLIGSSLGGFVAVEAAAVHRTDALHPIRQLILLAPAVELQWERWEEIGAGGIDRWRRSGHIEVFHYAYDEPRTLAYTFYVDAMRYAPARRRLDVPMLIFQGRQDDTVEPASVERFAHAQPRAVLHLLDDGHQLKESLEFMWREIERSGIFQRDVL